MTERRYNEEEVAAIFERAAESQQSPRRALASGEGGERGAGGDAGEGMTLRDLQEIGEEVGIDPALVADAARSLDTVGEGTSRPDVRRLLGLPIGVGRTVVLERHLTDRDWERLVVDLRETFDARGTVRTQGNLRQWTNGNLQALVEPTDHGDRVRLQTMKGNSRAYMMTGLALMAGALVMTAATAIGGGIGDSGSLTGIGMMGLSGAGLFGAGALRLPRWARLRRQQMDGIATRLTNAPPVLPPGDAR